MPAPGPRFCLPVLYCLWLIPAYASEPLVGVYTHGYTEPADAPVWEITHDSRGYHAQPLAEGEHTDVSLLSASGRAAFWGKCRGRVDSSATAWRIETDWS